MSYNSIRERGSASTSHDVKFLLAILTTDTFTENIDVPTETATRSFSLVDFLNNLPVPSEDMPAISEAITDKTKDGAGKLQPELRTLLALTALIASPTYQGSVQEFKELAGELAPFVDIISQLKNRADILQEENKALREHAANAYQMALAEKYAQTAIPQIDIYSNPDVLDGRANRLYAALLQYKTKHPEDFQVRLAYFHSLATCLLKGSLSPVKLPTSELLTDFHTLFNHLNYGTVRLPANIAQIDEQTGEARDPQISYIERDLPLLVFGSFLNPDPAVLHRGLEVWERALTASGFTTSESGSISEFFATPAISVLDQNYVKALKAWAPQVDPEKRLEQLHILRVLSQTPAGEFQIRDMDPTGTSIVELLKRSNIISPDGRALINPEASPFLVEIFWIFKKAWFSNGNSKSYSVIPRLRGKNP